ncbi:hypothetical protein BWI96_10330 [Siphonobacter sp. SORGH_AS_0500]|uniref:hypothetical protein n=1 Tax=Siphonobacter sp. SORGH_AS_0500 TaxID=1864824 RepID=UPI000CBC3E3C|nr:hypothetical protein [Siphonobacter sp. SORGH_AS_0500]PKK36761.1 hypothetical protein BWI96_10330 [Siphonobacter sp. SORGH_AS_0500]
MRYIDLDKLRVPSGWFDRAQTAKLAVAAGADPNDYSSVWRELKDGMYDLSSFKCWYCESNIDRSDNAVDHFRPKNSVSDAAKAHNGYRWLAFDKSNFRLSCTFCNSRRVDVVYGTSGGKADRFPLIDENTRVYVQGSILLEHPLLLDPCEIEDCELIGCKQENGEPCAASTDPLQEKRAQVSIEVYHLDRDATNILRHTAAAGLISDILEAKIRFDVAQIDGTKKPDFMSVAKRIKRRIVSDAPYSGEMKYLLRGQRSAEHPWINQLLEA